MNTMTFVFGQLLTLELFAAGQQPSRWPLARKPRNYGQSHHSWKEFMMDNSILVILFLIVSLIANFSMPARRNDQSQ